MIFVLNSIHFEFHNTGSLSKRCLEIRLTELLASTFTVDLNTTWLQYMFYLNARRLDLCVTDKKASCKSTKTYNAR